MRAILMLCLLCVYMCSANYVDNLDRYISCHTTHGNEILATKEYEPLYAQYGDTGTCNRLSGMKENELIGIGVGPDLFQLTLELPPRVQQVNNDTKFCAKPEQSFLHEAELKEFTENAFEDIETGSGFLHEAESKEFTGDAFEDIETGSGFLHEAELKEFTENAFEDIETGSGFLHEAELKQFTGDAFEDIETGSGFLDEAELQQFTGNAINQIPYEMHKNKSMIHMTLLEEDQDMVFDIPEYIDYDRNNNQKRWFCCIQKKNTQT